MKHLSAHEHLSPQPEPPKPHHYEELGLTVIIHCSIQIRGKVKNKFKSKGPLLEFVSGDDFTYSTGRWSDLKRTIDHENDSYSEIITDKVGGEVIHKCEEPLSLHTGHGSARKKKA